MLLTKYYLEKTPEGEAMMDARRKELQENGKAMRSEILSSPEGQEMIREKLAESKASLTTLTADLHEVRTALTTCPENETWAWQLTEEQINTEIKKIRNQIRRYEMWLVGEWREIGSGQPFDLAAIKEIPIETIMPIQPSYKSGDRATYRCPIHDGDRVPSFVWYRKKNNFYCFGCNESGDIIDLYQKLNDCNFIEACRKLTSF